MLCGETYGNNRCFEKDESIIDVISNAFGDISGFDKISVLDEVRAYMKKFNTTGACFSDRHYMVSLDQRIDQFKELVDAETYFVFNRARQYGKTTVLKALEKELQAQYYVASLDFQM